MPYCNTSGSTLHPREHAKVEQDTSLGGLAHDRLRTMRAAAGVDGNLAEAFGAFLGGGIGRGRVLPHARHQGVDRGHYEEIDCSRNQQERYRGINKVADGKQRSVDSKLDGGKIWLADDGGDEWCQ